MRPVLVIQSARPKVLEDYLARRGTAAGITVLGRSPVADGEVERLEVPPGRMHWRRLGADVQEALRRQRWSAIVVLHNLGDDSYRDVLAIALRAQATAPITIYYADGVEHLHRSALTLVGARTAWSGLASLALGLLIGAALPVAALRAIRARRPSPARR